MPSRDGARAVSPRDRQCRCQRRRGNPRLYHWSTSRTGSTWYQQQLPGRLAAFQIAVGLYHLLQRINVFDPQLELFLANHSEYGPRTLLQFLTSNDVVSYRRTRQVERSFLRQRERIERRDRSARAAKERHHAAW